MFALLVSFGFFPLCPFLFFPELAFPPLNSMSWNLPLVGSTDSSLPVRGRRLPFPPFSPSPPSPVPMNSAVPPLQVAFSPVPLSPFFFFCPPLFRGLALLTGICTSFLGLPRFLSSRFSPHPLPMKRHRLCPPSLVTLSFEENRSPIRSFPPFPAEPAPFPTTSSGTSRFDDTPGLSQDPPSPCKLSSSYSVCPRRSRHRSGRSFFSLFFFSRAGPLPPQAPQPLHSRTKKVFSKRRQPERCSLLEVFFFLIGVHFPQPSRLGWDPLVDCHQPPFFFFVFWRPLEFHSRASAFDRSPVRETSPFLTLLP